MAILKIARMGHPVLMRTAEPVDDPRAPAVHRLIADMIDTMRDAPGIGLAAPQVHAPVRVVVFHVPGERIDDAEDAGGVPLTVLINPEITPLSEDMEDGVEGCLSVPGMQGVVPRYARIRYTALQPDGSLLEREATGYHARVVQHECDHLDGVLYPMRMRDMSKFGFSEEIARAQVEARRAAEREAGDETA